MPLSECKVIVPILLFGLCCYDLANDGSPLKVVRGDGEYAGGQVTVRPLPKEVHGTKASRTVHLRRMSAVATQEEIAEWSKKECAKVHHWFERAQQV